MKIKRVIAVFLTGCILLAGCGKTANSTADVSTNESGSEDTIISDTATTEESAESSVESSDGTEQAANSASYEIGGGNPWLNSNIKENVVNSEKPSEKDDFNMAVNYDWVKTNDIPEGYSSYSGFTIVSQIIDEKAIATLEDESLEGHDAELVRAMYNGFLDWDSRNEEGLTPLEPYVKDIESLSSISDVSEYVCDVERSIFTPTLVSVENAPDLTDSTRYVTDFDHTSLLLGDSAEYKTLSTVGQLMYDAYRKLFVSMMTRMGYTEDQANAYYDASMAYETALAESVLTSVELADPSIYEKILNYYEPSQMKDLAPNFPVEEFIKASGYDNAEVFIVTEPNALTKISELYTDENLDIIKGYMIVQTVIGCAADLDRESFEANLAAANEISGSTGALSDQKYAYSVVNGALPEPMEKAYMTKYDTTETKKVITQICKDVAAVYREMLQGEDWLSDQTREYAIEKLDTLSINVVEPQEYLDYSKLNLEGLSYFEMKKALEEYSVMLDHEYTNGTVNKNLWGMSTLLTNAFYNPTNNSINILLGILDEDFYNDDMSKEQIYAGIGSVIGHEISHAFDTNGAQFDKDGNYSNWWTDEDYTAFQNRAQKLIDYYNGITVYGDENAIGSMVQTEAIADMAGIKAMLTLAAKEENFDYKLFFESYAHIWKEISTYEDTYSQLTQDPHPLSYLRVNASVQQFDEFYNAFDVKEGDGMYLAPDNRVLVW
jgi:putative endopeptidase